LAALPADNRQSHRGFRPSHEASRAETKEASEEAYSQAQTKQRQEAPSVGRVLLLYVDEAVDDATPFGSVRNQAFTIMPREALLTAGKRLSEKPVSQMELRWQEVNRTAPRFKTSAPARNAARVLGRAGRQPWLAALDWMKGVFSRQQRLAQRPVVEIPGNTIPERLRPYLLTFDDADEPIALRGDRYEFWIYRQLRKRLAAGELYLDDSVLHRRFSDELVALERKDDVIEGLDIPWLRQPIEAGLDALFAELDQLWRDFDGELRQGKLTHLAYDAQRKTLTWRKPGRSRRSRAERLLCETAGA
jgi:hypothetical protein